MDSSDSDQLRSLLPLCALTASYPLLNRSSLFQFKFFLQISLLDFKINKQKPYQQHTCNISNIQVPWNQRKETLDLDGKEQGYFWFDIGDWRCYIPQFYSGTPTYYSRNTLSYITLKKKSLKLKICIRNL